METLVASKPLEAKVLLRVGFDNCVSEALEMPMTKIRWSRLWVKGRRDCPHCRHRWTPCELDRNSVKELIWMFKKMKRILR